MEDLPAVLHSHRLGRQPYVPVWRAMQAHLAERSEHTPDSLWHVEHPPVFTLGRNAGPSHLRAPGAVPVVRVDRGGQVTYHGPGQAVVYLLLDLRRYGLGVRALVDLLQAAVIDALGELGVRGSLRPDAPGVYVGGAKIAALGLRVRGGLCMHGLSLNVNPRLDEFRRIDPCGFPGLLSTSLHALGCNADLARSGGAIEQSLARRLGVGVEVRDELPGSLLRELARPASPPRER